jgi:hypothetical protein
VKFPLTPFPLIAYAVFLLGGQITPSPSRDLFQSHSVDPSPEPPRNFEYFTASENLTTGPSTAGGSSSLALLTAKCLQPPTVICLQGQVSSSCWCQLYLKPSSNQALSSSEKSSPLLTCFFANLSHFEQC